MDSSAPELTTQNEYGNPTEKRAPVINRKHVLRKDRGYWCVRRSQDILLSGIALLLLWPLMLILMLVIYLDDPKGDAIFRQTRCGRNGKEFTMLKFRSMCVDAETHLEELLSQNEMDGPTFKMRDDPRITKVGRFIRKTSLDELPQLINIFRGDMSFVGPRPPLPREVEQYDDYTRQRLYVTPGLTCYWQIQPRRNDLSFEEWLELDLKYIRERSLITDWKIMFRTITVVFRGEGV